MDTIIHIKTWVHNAHFLPLELVGMITIVGFYIGRLIMRIHLPSILGYMLVGVLLGPSLFDFLNDAVQEKFIFITQIALGFVAFSIGIELKMSALKKLGKGIIYVIFAEALGAFILVFIFVYLLTHDLPLSLIFASIAPASAPAGTVAVIQEYKARGNLTKALYAVVGFDDGLGIIIFGFASNIAKNILLMNSGAESIPLHLLLMEPFKEIILSFVIGVIFAYLFCTLIKKISVNIHLFILSFGFVLLITGVSEHFHLSYILTNMVFGICVVNNLNVIKVQKIEKELKSVMPVLFILFFTLAGAHLHVKSVFSLGALGIVYILSRSCGLMGGAWVGAVIGKMEDKIKKYLGLGILSQAGVAIGLSLIVKQEFQGIGKLVSTAGDTFLKAGDKLGMTVITSITVTCIFFEIIGPICTKIGLKKAREINQQ